MSKEEIYNLAEQANNACEDRFWIVGDRYFICHNIEDMDDFDELSEEHFINRAKATIATAKN